MTPELRAQIALIRKKNPRLIKRLDVEWLETAVKKINFEPTNKLLWVEVNALRDLRSMRGIVTFVDQSSEHQARLDRRTRLRAL